MKTIKMFISAVAAASIICCTAFAAPYSTEPLKGAHLNFDIFKYINPYVLEEKDENAENNYNEKNEENEKKDETQNSSDSSDARRVTMRSMARDMCVAESVSNVLYNGDNAFQVSYRYGDGSKSCIFTDSSRNRGGHFSYLDIQPGTVFFAGVSEEGVVESYAVAAVINESIGVPIVDSGAVTSNFNMKVVSYDYSYISDFRRKNGGSVITLGNGNSYAFSSDAMLYSFDNSGRISRVVDGTVFGGDVDIPMYDEEADRSAVYMIFVMTYRDEVMSACSFGVPVYVKGNAEK